MRILTFLFSASLLFCHLGKTCLLAQAGCTDPQALNFNDLATENDGSCTYPATSFSPVQLSLLPAELDECSGLLFFNHHLWTHEDGGAADKLFIIDSLDGDLLETITLPGVDNLDWEDLAQDSLHVYVGDFGNNDGNRTDLRILKYKKADLLAGSPTPEIIEFSYSDQTDFTAAPNANDFDCEAFFFWQDSLHLFSKNWLNFKTRHYVLPATPGEQVAQLRDSLFVQGQITGADVSAGGKAVLLGYNSATSETFLWLLFDFNGSQFFSGNKRKISLGSAIANSQVEGICFRNETYGYVCSERFSALPQKLLAFHVGQWTQNPSAATEPAADFGVSVNNPFSNFLTVKCERQAVHLELSDAAGRVVLKSILQENFTRFDTAHLPSGRYVLTLRKDTGETIFQQIIRQ